MLERNRTGLIGKRIDADTKRTQYAPLLIAIIALAAFILLISGCAIDRTGEPTPSEIVNK